MNVLSSIALLSAFLNLVLGTIAIVNAPRSRLNRLFLLETVLVTIWVFACALVYSEKDPTLLWLFSNISTAGNLNVNPTVLLFIAYLVGTPLKKAFLMALPFYILSITFSLMLLQGHYYTKEFVSSPFGNVSIHNVGDPTYWLFNIFYLMYVGIIIALYRFAAKAKSNRLRALGLLLGNGLTAAVFVHLIFNQVVPFLGINFPLIGDIFSTLIFSCCEMYAIFRFRLIDLKSLAVDGVIVQHLSSAVAVFDTQLQVVRANDFALKTIRASLQDSLPTLDGICQESSAVLKVWEGTKGNRAPQKNLPCTTAQGTLLLDLIPLFDHFDDFVGGLAILHGHETFESLVARFSLTDRERDIFLQLMYCDTNKEIAYKLHISLDTVKSHVKNIYAKIGIASRAELIRLVE